MLKPGDEFAVRGDVWPLPPGVGEVEEAINDPEEGPIYRLEREFTVVYGWEIEAL